MSINGTLLGADSAVVATGASTNLVAASTQYWKTANASTALEVASITIEAWVKPTALSSRFIVTGKRFSGNAYSYLFVVGNTANKVTCFFENPADVNIVSTSNITANAWNHIAVTYDGTTAKIYLQGSSTADNTATLSQAIAYDVTNHPFTIGDSLASDNTTADNTPFDGKIDEVRVWNVVRTGAQINSDFNKELVGNETNLIGYWKFNNDGTDSQTNAGALNLTGVNSPTFSTDVPF